MDHEVWGFILQIIIVVASVTAYIHLRENQIKKEIIELFSKQLNQLEADHGELLGRYNRRGNRLKKALRRVKENYIKLTTADQSILFRIYNNEHDIDFIYKTVNANKVNINRASYEKWLRKMSPDFDTLEGIDDIEDEDVSQHFS